VIATIVVPGEPVAKGRGRVSGNRVFTPAKTRNYENLVRMAAHEAMQGRAPVEGPISLNLRICLPIPASKSARVKGDMAAGHIRPTKRPDADNYLKAFLDGCNGIVFVDDAQVTDILIKKTYDMVPRLQCIVTKAEGIAA